MFCLWEKFSLRVCHIQIRKHFTNFFVYNALHGATLANCSHFQYVSRLRHRVIWIGVKSLHRCNSLRRTLCHLHNREIFPYSTKDNFDRRSVIHSWITIVPSCQTHGEVHNRSGTQHSILYRTYDWGMGKDFSFSFYFLLWSGFESLLDFTPCNIGKNSFDYSFFKFFKNLSRYVLVEKIYQASCFISIDLDSQ